jgi:hypothetical protein
MAVLWILDLQPPCRFVLAVASGAVLGDDPLKVLSAYLRKRTAAVALDVLGEEDRTGAPGHDRAQELLSLDER